MNLAEQKYLDKFDNRPGPRLEKWSKGYKGHPDILTGIVYGHWKFRDGEFIHTSRVLFMTEIFAQTRNTTYALGARGS
jgi:hypothetical protein